ncbi:protein asteroid homolog 1-like [Sinocyclocheilus rhinocerous]|uniref:protein asteroid homolog 1-like n=1 Tax=Sinocyclocheilus rhinocerous TaxID=307959 RepID=UPI0007B9EB23|nr:PREDICTED: protein asteroid homolog 1-like [Sinocyclocheilus rhinocerous]
MGVRGLKTYIESRNRNDLRSWAFRDKQLIIDGCNLYYTLYYDCNLDQMHGGDYDAFEELIIQFFKNLRACAIRPYVVLDGGADHTDKKWDTIRQRKQDKINAAFALSVGKKEKVLPILVKSVFRQLLHKLKVPLVQCLEEADWEIAALAEEWNCPVLSNDSDFYIFNIKAGLLPITHFQWKNVKVHRQTNKKFIQAKHFTVGKFCASFDMNIDLLPVFASILGNDYVKLQNIKCLTWAEYSVPGTHHAHIDGLLNWLCQFPEPEAAVSALLKRTDDKEKAITQEALSKGIHEYKLFPGSLAQFFHSKTIPRTARTGPLQVLPKWTLKLLLEGKMSSSIIDALVHQRVFMTSQVEDFQLPCSSETSRPIRQVIYGLLLLGEQQTADKQALDIKTFTGTSKCYVEEYGRQQSKLSSQKVEAIQTGVMEGLQLKTLRKEPLSVQLQVLLDTLGVSSEMFRGIQPALHLQMFVTHYWLVNAQPQPSQVHLWGLLLGMVYGKFSSTPKRHRDMLLTPKKPQAAGRRMDLEHETAHLYSQWQSCLKWSLCLNSLLCFPVSEPEVACLYRGTLVHHVVGEFRRGITLDCLLVRGSSAERLFKQLQDAVVSLVGEDFIKKMRTGLEHRAAGKTQRDYNDQNQPIDELSSSFEHLMYEDINDCEDDDDLNGKGRKSKAKDHKSEMPDVSYTIRTRHKAKARNANHPSKKSERRCFE